MAEMRRRFMLPIGEYGPIQTPTEPSILCSILPDRRVGQPCHGFCRCNSPRVRRPGWKCGADVCGGNDVPESVAATSSTNEQPRFAIAGSFSDRGIGLPT